MNSFNVEPSDLYFSAMQLREKGCVFQYIEDRKFNGRKVIIDNKELLYFASCSYLGLETHPDLIEGAIEATRYFGTQTPSSRAVLSSPLYKEVENLLKKIFPGFQIVTQTVTLGHFSVLPLLIEAGDAIILDAYVHNSVRMASQQCRANGTPVFLAKHNNLEHVKYLIYRLKKGSRRKYLLHLRSNHPVMFFSETEFGSCLLSVNGDTLSLQNIREDAMITDLGDSAHGDTPLLRH